MSDVLAVDLGGSSMRAALTADDGTVRSRCERPTPRSPTAQPLIELVGVVLAGREVGSAVVGVPGRVDYRVGVLEHAPNLAAGWADELTEVGLGDALGVDVALANDADLAAVGEAWFGAGRDHRDVAYLTISTGIGAGVVTGGLLVHGRRSLAEIGHSVVDWRGLAQGRATVEQLGSGTALRTLAAEAGLDADGREVERRWRAGDPTASDIWHAVVTVAAAAAVNLAQLFVPEVIVVGGGVGLVGDAVLEPMRALLAGWGPFGLPEPVRVVNAALGDDAALAGAAAWERAFTPAAASRPTVP
ncbi:MAG: ROK family protein [Actinobacteria bacterium]|nr:ROK family protein [Actinomycetota bacterium]